MKSGYLLVYWVAAQVIDQDMTINFSDALEMLEVAMAFGTADAITFTCVDGGEVLYTEEYFRTEEEWSCYRITSFENSLVKL